MIITNLKKKKKKKKKKKRPEYIKKISAQLEDTRKTNPKLFWKTLNDMKCSS